MKNMNLDEAKRLTPDVDENADHDLSGGSDQDVVKTSHKHKQWDGKNYETTTERVTFDDNAEIGKTEEINRHLVFLGDGEIYSEGEQSPHVWCTVHESEERFVILRDNGRRCFAGHWVCQH